MVPTLLKTIKLSPKHVKLPSSAITMGIISKVLADQKLEWETHFLSKKKMQFVLDVTLLQIDRKKHDKGSIII